MRDRSHGLPTGWYDEQNTKQSGLCAICKTPQRHANYRGLCVDHDHKTGHIRGLLCADCNHALGKLKDDPNLCEIAAKYLRADYSANLKSKAKW